MSKQSGSSYSRRNSMNKRRKTGRSVRKTRTRKPKYLSLRLQLSADKTRAKESGRMPEPEPESDARPQLNLFPLHPENLLEERDAENDVVSYDFFSAAEDSGATTLTGLLGAPSTSISSGEEYNNNNSEKNNRGFSSSDSLRYPYGCRGAALVQTALRNKGERKPPCEEKWVCYSAVVESGERKDEEVTSSCASDLRRRVEDNRRRLSLKLDYEEIINAWSDKGSLYINAESPQTVPDIIHDDFFSNFHETSCHGRWGGWESNRSLFTVPEMAGSSSSKCKIEGEMPEGGGDEETKQTADRTHRAASVLRYKEKRQNRLFSKTIRYQVRKLNAEKRPRVKGRFVKRD